MAMRMKYRKNPESLGEDVRKAREVGKTEEKKDRIRPATVGKRELLSRGIRTEEAVNAYLALPENAHRRVSGKTLRKAVGNPA